MGNGKKKILGMGLGLGASLVVNFMTTSFWFEGKYILLGDTF